MSYVNEISFEMRKYSWEHRAPLCQLCKKPAIVGLAGIDNATGFVYCIEHAHKVVDSLAWHIQYRAAQEQPVEITSQVAGDIEKEDEE